MSAARIIHGARKLDAGGQVDDFWLATEGERIVATGSGSGWRAYADGAETTDAGGRWLTPGFIDLHSHGAGGAAYEAIRTRCSWRWRLTARTEQRARC